MDAVVALADECPPASCLASADEPESAVWINDGASAETVFAVARARDAEDDTATLSIALDVRTPALGDYCAAPFDLTAEELPYAWDGDLSAFGDGFAGGAGCVAAEGRDLWFAVEVPAGQWLRVTNATATEVALHVAESCSAGACAASGAGEVLWTGDGATSQVVTVGVEGIAGGGGALDLTFETLPFPPTMFGPDAFGYTGAVDDDVSICPDLRVTGAPLGVGDEGVASVELGVDFPFYGVTRTTAEVAGNGLVSFGDPVTTMGNQPLPASFYDQPLVAPFWTDLNPSAPGAEVYVEPGAGSFAIQWYAPVYGASDFYDIRAMLDAETGAVHFCYVDTEGAGTAFDAGAAATSGIQQGSSVGLQYSYNEDLLASGTHVWFTAP